MAKPKAQTLQQRFGFLDKELTTPEHDKMMIWLDQNAESVIGSISCAIYPDVHAAIGSYVDNIKDRLNSKASPVWDETSKAAYDQYKEKADYHLGPDLWLVDCDITDDVIKEVARLARQLPAPDGYELEIIKKVWENPIVDRTYTIGFCDMTITVSLPRIILNRQVYPIQQATQEPHRWKENETEWRVSVKEWVVKVLGWEVDFRPHDRMWVYFEVKPSIPSLGELVRQIRMYQTYTGNAPWFVVCPDDQFRDHLESQGIGFIKYDPSITP